MRITKAPIVKCKKCFTVNPINIDEFEETGRESNERNMGYEIGYLWTMERDCIRCNNTLEVTIEAWEYPVGILNHTEYSTTGCSFVEEPKVEVEFDNGHY